MRRSKSMLHWKEKLPETTLLLTNLIPFTRLCPFPVQKNRVSIFPGHVELCSTNILQRPETLHDFFLVHNRKSNLFHIGCLVQPAILLQLHHPGCRSKTDLKEVQCARTRSVFTILSRWQWLRRRGLQHKKQHKRIHSLQGAAKALKVAVLWRCPDNATSDHGEVPSWFDGRVPRLYNNTSA